MKYESQKINTVSCKIIAKTEGQETGRVFIYLIKNNLRQNPYALIEDLFVKETYRSKGIGKKLLGLAIRKARSYGCYKIIANSRSSRNKVHDFYLKNGFKKYGFEFRIDI
jgi:GNAT superfamily N-acetyltransferase